MDTNVFAQSQAVPTGDGTFSLKHPVHGELFHSFSGAALEAKDLYLGASSIKTHWQSSNLTRVLDVGLGLGYNALVTLCGFLAQPRGELHLTSLELERELVELLRSGAASWQQGWPSTWLDLVTRLQPTSGTTYAACGATWRWHVICGDALQAQLPGPFDYIWQDPFSPAKNPTMWGADWFGILKDAAHQGTELMSYSVSRPVKDALQAAGWQYQRIPTTTAKRHWLRATPISTT